ncbi:MAG: polysaccharide biosynthesis protein [Dehalococcoidia bacterium]|nr:polysaccharide biosynthesis protein [Dehalococcoidia bacterium]
MTQYALIAVGQQRLITLAFVIGASFNFLTNLALIPTYGILGAAATTVASELILMVPFFYGVRKYVGPLPLLGICARPVAAAAIMGLVLVPMLSLPLVAVVAIGAVVYAVALLALGTFDEEDKAILRGILAR